MKIHRIAAGLAVFGGMALAAAQAQPPAPAAGGRGPARAAGPVEHADFSKDENWVCRPGRQDACTTALDATVVTANGKTTRANFVADPNAPIDCFYIYPTVSNDLFTMSDLVANQEERNVVQHQLALLGSKCRLYAPMYRQTTLTALRARVRNTTMPPARGNPGQSNADVDDAFDYYMQHDNKGRGVVILGHSQGAGQVARLIRAKVDGQPAQKLLVSTLIVGGSVTVPPGKDVGGTFKSIPACRKPSQFGCVIAYGSYRDTVPPGPTGGVGAGAVTATSEGLCVNPAALAGGKGSPKAYWGVEAPLNSSVKPPPRWTAITPLYTTFAMTPGLVTSQCVKKNNRSYLEIHVNADPKDPRADDVYGDVMLATGLPDPGWGLHNVDMNIGMGDFVDLVASQGAAWRAANKGK